MCVCNYCIDSYLTFNNQNSKCLLYKAPIDIEDLINCPICFEDMINAHKVKCHQCSKQCCLACIRKWSNKKIMKDIAFTCPMCRTPLKIIEKL